MVYVGSVTIDDRSMIRSTNAKVRRSSPKTDRKTTKASANLFSYATMGCSFGA